jgi:hypothetical protein
MGEQNSFHGLDHDEGRINQLTTEGKPRVPLKRWAEEKPTRTSPLLPKMAGGTVGLRNLFSMSVFSNFVTDNSHDSITFGPIPDGLLGYGSSSKS